jgi:hypothetical protein
MPLKRNKNIAKLNQLFAQSVYIYEDSNLLYQLSDVIAGLHSYEPNSSRSLLLQSGVLLKSSKHMLESSRKKKDMSCYGYVRSINKKLKNNHFRIKTNYFKIRLNH